jgi:uncharacterized membrane protein
MSSRRASPRAKHRARAERAEAGSPDRSNFVRKIGNDPHFRWRGSEVSRIEAISDAVFGMALALLGVPIFELGKFVGGGEQVDLAKVLLHLPAFGASFALLATIWYSHHLIFRRYNLSDTRSNTLNALLLALVVFFVLPLRYLFTLTTSDMLQWADLIDEPLIGIAPNSGRSLVLTFSLAFFGISGVFALLYANALRLRVDLELDASEVRQTRLRIALHATHMAIAVLSILLAYGVQSRWGGYVYLLVVPLRVHNWKQTHGGGQAG